MSEQSKAGKYKLFTDSKEMYAVAKRSFANIERVGLLMTKCMHLSLEDRQFYCRLANRNPDDFTFVNEFDVGNYCEGLAEVLFQERIEITEKNRDKLDHGEVYAALGFFLSRLGLTYPDSKRLVEYLQSVQKETRMLTQGLLKHGVKA